MKEWDYQALPEGFTSFQDSHPDENYTTFGWYGWLLVEWKDARYIVSARAMCHPDCKDPYWEFWIQEKITQQEANEMKFIAWKCNLKDTRY